MRGKGSSAKAWTDKERITPACAGKSDSEDDVLVMREDHPRLRGEKLNAEMKLSKTQGSPPLARGKAIIPRPTIALFRITPACAGKRSIPRTRKRSRRDHPRLRGEKLLEHVFHVGRKGSPPLARGKVGGFRARGDAERDHPRLRGEKQTRQYEK